MNKKLEKKICREYIAGAKQVELAFKYNIPKQKITEILTRNKVPIRRRKPQLKQVLIIVIIMIILWVVLKIIASL